MSGDVLKTWKAARDLKPGDMVLHQHELGTELRLIISSARRQEKNRTLCVLSWVEIGGNYIEYKYGWFWNNSQHIVLEDYF